MSSVLTKEYSVVRSLSRRIFGYWVFIFVSPLGSCKNDIILMVIMQESHHTHGDGDVIAP